MTRPVHLDDVEIELHAAGSLAAGEAASPHLAECAECSAAVSRAASRRQLLTALPEPALDEAAFRRVERALFAPKPEPRWRWLFAPAFGLALTAAALVLFLRPAPRAPAPEPAAAVVEAAPEAAPEPAPAPFASAAAHFVQGAVELRREEGSWEPLTLTPALPEGAAIRTGDGRVAVSLEPGRGFVIEPNTTLELVRVRSGQTLLRLGSGSVSCSLSPLAAGESFAVQAGPRWVRVVGTAFAVSRWPTRVLVEVEHGTVALADDERGPAGVRISGPGDLEVADDAALGLSAARTLGPEQAAKLSARPSWTLARGDAPPLATMVISEPAGATVQVDELGWGPIPLIGQFGLGAHRLRARIGGREIETSVVLKQGAEPTQVRLPRAVASRPPEEDPEAEALAAEIGARISARTRDLRYCYEHWLKRNPEAAGRLGFKFTLSDGGTVEAMDLSPEPGAAQPDGPARQCFEEAVEGLTFPAGAPADLEVPFDFKPGEGR